MLCHTGNLFTSTIDVILKKDLRCTVINLLHFPLPSFKHRPSWVALTRLALKFHGPPRSVHTRLLVLCTTAEISSDFTIMLVFAFICLYSSLKTIHMLKGFLRFQPSVLQLYNAMILTTTGSTNSIVYFKLFYIQLLKIETERGMKRNEIKEWCFRPQFFNSKVILDRGKCGLMSWNMLWSCLWWRIDRSTSWPAVPRGRKEWVLQN